MDPASQITPNERKILTSLRKDLAVNPWAIRLARATFGVSVGQLAEAARSVGPDGLRITEEYLSKIERYIKLPRALHVAEACAIALGLEPLSFAADSARLRADRERYDRWRKDGSPPVLEWADLDAAAPNVALYRPATAGQAADLSAAAENILQAAQWHLQVARALDVANDQQGARTHRLWATAALQMATARVSHAFPATAPPPRPSGAIIPQGAAKPAVA